jgi:hypothetical protein
LTIAAGRETTRATSSDWPLITNLQTSGDKASVDANPPANGTDGQAHEEVGVVQSREDPSRWDCR